MPDDPSRPDAPAPEGVPPDADPRERGSGGVSDFVRRAVAAGFEAAGRSKEDVVRAAAGEIRTWLDHLELDNELRKALSTMVLEVKAEIRFRPTEDGKLAPTGETEVKVRTVVKP